MIHFELSDIESWDRIYRANFINSLTGFKSVNLIGTVNEEGKTNLAIFSSIVHIGSNPALIGFINRPKTSTTHTLSNIEKTGVYTINQINSSFVKEAHQTSGKYPLEQSEFDVTGLTPKYINDFKAPFVAQSLVRVGLTLAQIIPISLNHTFLVIGKINHIQIEDTIPGEDGFLSLNLADTITSNGNDAYYTVKELVRLPYVKL